jgi:hypothetical protein
MMIDARPVPASAKYAAVTVPVVAGWLFLFAAVAMAATGHGGAATIARPGTTAAGALGSGGSSTPFTVVLPANASCSGDTAHDGYHVYSYLVPRGTDLATVTFVNFPSKGYGLVDTTGRYYGAVNTALDTGQIIGIPNDFVWGRLVGSAGGAVALKTLVGGTSHGHWEAGIACATTHGRLADVWNTQVTFTADARDAHGFVWHAVPGGSVGPSALPATGAVAGAAPTSPSTGARGTPGSRAGSGAGSTAHGSTSSGSGGAGQPADPSGSGSSTATDVPVAAAVCAGAVALAAGLLLLVSRSRRAHPTPVPRGSLR